MNNEPSGRKAALYLYQHSAIGRERAKAAQKKYRASPKGRAANNRARSAYRARKLAALPLEVRRDIRRERITRGLPPDVPPMPRGARSMIETATAERLRPEYIAAALALEDLI